MSGFAVIDFETTGFVAEKNDRVVEVGVVLLDESGTREHSWTTLVNPKRDVGASHIHGITGGDVLDAPEFSEISDELLALIAGRAVVAHNAPFDMRFLHQELLRAGYSIDERPRALCSMKWSGRLLGPAKLAHCCEALGIPLDDAHTALADAEATGKLLARLMELGSTLTEWMDEIEAARSFRWPARRGQRTANLATRQAAIAATPGSWIADVLNDAWIPGNSEEEASYLLALNDSLLDLYISKSEARALVQLAQETDISSSRMLELHREHLRQVAAEAWSDGVLTEEELSDLSAIAGHLNLTEADVASALDSTRAAHVEPRQTLLQPGDRVVFTGTLRRPREDWISEITAAGLATGAITKSTRVVVAADPDSLSGKAEKARTYGVPVINEQAFEKHFEDYRQADRPMAL